MLILLHSASILIGMYKIGIKFIYIGNLSCMKIMTAIVSNPQFRDTTVQENNHLLGDPGWGQAYQVSLADSWILTLSPILPPDSPA